MDETVLDFATRLEHAGDLDSWFRETVNFFQGQGIRWVNYGFMGAGTARNPEGDIVWVNNFSKAVNNHFHHPGAWKHDYAALHCATSLTPIGMGVETMPPGIPPELTRMAIEAADFGLRSGVALPMRVGNPRRVAGMSLSGGMNRGEFEALLRENGTALNLAAFYAHARAQQLVQEDEASSVRLTPREREVLLWVACGRTSKEIAQALDLSPQGVNFHVANAMEKLDATSRAHAVARAITLGLIDP